MREKILSNIYADHNKGAELLAIDLEDYENQIRMPLYEEIAELKQRITYLEFMENQLRDENAMLRTQLINGNVNKTD